MQYWITPDGNYYIGESVAEGSIPVTKTPDDTHDWDGTKWVQNSGKDEQKISNALEAAVDAYINSVAQADKWDSRITCALRAAYPNPWQGKAIAFGQWMDSCYVYCYQVQTDVKAGIRTLPTESQLISELPVMVWP